MNRSMTDKADAHNVRVDVFRNQMRALSRREREAITQELDRQNVAELERSAIARRIKQARKEAGLSQPEMADALGVIPRTYQNYESVKEPRVPWQSMNDIAKITGKSTEWLLHGDTVAAATPDPFDGPTSQLAERLDRLVSAMEERLQHDRVIDEMLERQTAILTRIELLIAQSQDPEPADREPGESRGFEIPWSSQGLRDALGQPTEAPMPDEETPRKRGFGDRGA